jgi:hypothetical protein
MKYLKSFNESVNGKKELNHSIIQFLIHNEKELRIMFDNYTIEKGEYQWEIVAKTKADMSGYKPPMDDVRFPMEEFFTWVSKQTYKSDVFKIKSNLFKEIIESNGRKKEPDEMESKLIDSILGQFGAWKLCLAKIKIIRNIVSKYKVDDIDDRCLEYFDELQGWKPKFMIGYQLCETVYRSLVKDDIYEAWMLLEQVNRFINDPSLGKHHNFKNLLTIISSYTKPCINIIFNISQYDEELYDYKVVKKVAVGIYNRLSKLYPITGVEYAHSYYDEDRYENKSIPLGNYRLVLFLD